MADIKTNKHRTIKILNIKTFFGGYFFQWRMDNGIRMIQKLPK